MAYRILKDYYSRVFIRPFLMTLSHLRSHIATLLVYHNYQNRQLQHSSGMVAIDIVYDFLRNVKFSYVSCW